MSGAFLAGLVAGYGVAIPVGAIAILILGLSARTSFRVGAAAALAVATADGLYAAVAALGGAGLAGIVAPVAGPLRVVAAAVLLGLAAHGLWRTWYAHRSRQTSTTPVGRGLSTPGRAFAAVLGLTLLNPTTVLYFAALVLGRRDTADEGSAALFVAGVFLASASWQLLIAGGGTVVGRALTGPRGRLVTGLVSSALIAALAVAALLRP
ncbi:LysE family transporter [Micromonospora parathelypteridis]|uniref:Arginine exporter protein ArgO n=1 Tax=Micromonospora parathelypteridis TaxID=1839617 RepID=A0A840VHT2_9ACTN|nr:LysE family transporter [Micromonospora parathelypteridis]MBB5476432.1 arginine exporter protein ArgO [Micromonospora parathelypteridis]GGO15119.1 lysine transporter LysE [Micromonospora parathelypteridis]